MTEADDRRRAFPRWTPVGVGVGNVVIAVVIHAFGGSRPAAVTVAAVLIVVAAVYLADERWPQRQPVSPARSWASLPPKPAPQTSKDDDQFVVVGMRSR